LAKLSISIPDDLKELLEARAESEKMPVSHVVSDALKAYFALPNAEIPEQPDSPRPTSSSEELRQVQEYLWELHQSYERTRSSALVLYHWAERSGEQLLGIPPESSFKKPPWPKPRPRPSSP